MVYDEYNHLKQLIISNFNLDFVTAGFILEILFDSFSHLAEVIDHQLGVA